MPRTFLISGDRIKWLISDYKAETDMLTVASMVFDISKHALEAGLNLIKDSNYMLWIDSDRPQKYKDLFLETNTTVFQFNLEAPLPVLLERLRARVEKSEKEGKKVSVKTEEKYMKYYDQYQKMKNTSFQTFDTTQQTSEEIASAILTLINDAQS